MWMDVFGSISLCKPPCFIEIYRSLFGPGGLDGVAESPVETNMDRVMGCPNEVILAFAEIANLEARKESLVRRLNEGLPPVQTIPGIVGFSFAWRGDDGLDPRARWQQEMASLEAEGRKIERLIPEALGPAALPMDRFVEIHTTPPNNFNSMQGTAETQPQNSEFNEVGLNLFGSGNTLGGFWSNMPSGSSNLSTHPVPDTDPGGYIDPDEDKRSKIAEVFRNAARVYLHSVISGCDPLVPAIRRAVQATIRALEVSTPLFKSNVFLGGFLLAPSVSEYGRFSASYQEPYSHYVFAFRAPRLSIVDGGKSPLRASPKPLFFVLSLSLFDT